MNRSKIAMSQKGPECTTSRHWIYRYRSHLSHMGPKGVIIWWYGSGDDDMLRNMMTRIMLRNIMMMLFNKILRQN